MNFTKLKGDKVVPPFPNLALKTNLSANRIKSKENGNVPNKGLDGIFMV